MCFVSDRTSVDRDFNGHYSSDEDWHGYINNNDRVLLKVWWLLFIPGNKIHCKSLVNHQPLIIRARINWATLLLAFSFSFLCSWYFGFSRICDLISSSCRRMVWCYHYMTSINWDLKLCFQVVCCLERCFHLLST